MAGVGCLATILRRPKSSRSRPSSKCRLPDSEETRINDANQYSTVAENIVEFGNFLKEALARVNLESLKPIVGIDFTKSNEWAGKRSFNRRSLHHVGDTPNPYEQVMSTIGKILASLGEDNRIPCFGFGDVTTHDDAVFSLCPDGRECNGFEEILTAYKTIVPSRKLAGPSSFAPIIEMAMSIVEKSGGQFHVLLIITSGQLNPEKQETIAAIIAASKFPLSIIIVGVGDGPWYIVKNLGDSAPGRVFDNLHFVNFTDIMTKNVPPSQKEAEFAQAALMKVPCQYKETRILSISGGQTGNFSFRVSLRESSFGTAAPPAATSTDEDKLCPICYDNSKNIVFYCGHQICSECKKGKIFHCPVCRIPVETDDYKDIVI